MLHCREITPPKEAEPGVNSFHISEFLLWDRASGTGATSVELLGDLIDADGERRG